MKALLFVALTAASALADTPIKVASFSPLLSEICEAVGGTAVSVETLLPAGMDPHEYRPTPQDLKAVSDAKLVLASGKHLEGYLDKLQGATGSQNILLAVGDQLPSLKMEEEDEHDHGSAGSDGLVEDPHWWHGVSNVMKATRIIRDELIRLDPPAKETYEENADEYLAKLSALNTWVKEKVAELPRDQRKLVTSHDAFQYFANEYGFKIHAIEGINPEQEPSAKEVDELIRTMRDERVRAIFLEDTLNPKVSSELTRETGVTIGGTLSADGLGTGESTTYEGMMKHNVTTIVEALK